MNRYKAASGYCLTKRQQHRQCHTKSSHHAKGFVLLSYKGVEKAVVDGDWSAVTMLFASRADHIHCDADEC